MVVSPGALRCVVGVVGNVISLFLFLSPLPTFIKIWKKRSVEQYSPVPYLVTYLNCMLWVVYGLPVVRPHSVLLLTVNAAGWFIQLTYLISFVACSKDKSKRFRVIIVVVIEIFFVAVVASLNLAVVHSTRHRIRIVGTIGVVTATMMYASPLSALRLVIKTKSVEYMPLSLSVASFSNALVWTIYGACPLDPYVAGPSMMGVLFGLAQFILYATYFKSTKQQKKEAALGDSVVIAKPEVGVVTEEIINGNLQLQLQLQAKV